MLVVDAGNSFTGSPFYDTYKQRAISETMNLIGFDAMTVGDREFVDVARQQGLSHARIMFGEILPNVASTIIVFIPLILANAILLEAALSFLGAGVQPPNPSWGTMISDGVAEIPAAIHLTLVPGIMLVLTVLGINVFGDGVRDALDPKAKVRG